MLMTKVAKVATNQPVWTVLSLSTPRSCDNFLLFRPLEFAIYRAYLKVSAGELRKFAAKLVSYQFDGTEPAAMVFPTGKLCVGVLFGGDSGAVCSQQRRLISIRPITTFWPLHWYCKHVAAAAAVAYLSSNRRAAGGWLDGINENSLVIWPQMGGRNRLRDTYRKRQDSPPLIK